MVDRPRIGKRGHERRIDHVPTLAVVLAFLVQHLKQRGARFTHRERPKLRENVRMRHFGVVALGRHLFENGLKHVRVVVVEGEAVFGRQAAADVERRQGRANLSELHVQVKRLVQFVPVVRRVTDARVHEEVEHAKRQMGMRLDGVLVQRQNAVVPQAQTRRVERKFGFLFSGNANPHVHGLGGARTQAVPFVQIVDDGC